MKKGIKEAIEAREKAYVPYSKFKVGAAIQLKDGTFIHGANIENASFSLTMCAERTALFNLKMRGVDKADIRAIFIVADANRPISPCGACRQVMHELMPVDTLVVLGDLNGNSQETTVGALLPYAFTDFESDEDEN